MSTFRCFCSPTEVIFTLGYTMRILVISGSTTCTSQLVLISGLLFRAAVITVVPFETPVTLPRVLTFATSALSVLQSNRLFATA